MNILLIACAKFTDFLPTALLIKRLFHTNDSAWYRIHKNDDNLLQVIYQVFAAYFEDDCADELTNEPVMSVILDKETLVSQPTLSRFFHRMDETIEENACGYHPLKAVKSSSKGSEISPV